MGKLESRILLFPHPPNWKLILCRHVGGDKTRHHGSFPENGVHRRRVSATRQATTVLTGMWASRGHAGDVVEEWVGARKQFHGCAVETMAKEFAAVP